MAVDWKKTSFLGVRYREHKTRKEGKGAVKKADRCYSIRYKIDGKDKEEVTGWASEGMTPEEAFSMLRTIRANIRLGVEPRSLAALRQGNEAKQEEERAAERRAQQLSVTLDEFWQATYLPVVSATKKAITMKNEKMLYTKWISPKLGAISLNKLRVSHFEDLVAYATNQKMSASTIRSILAVCSQVWTLAATREIVEGESPTRRVKKPRKDNKRVRFLTPAEATGLLAALRERSMDTHDMALLSLLCGLRAGEIHALTWADVDFEANTLYIRDPKNKESRHAIMGEEVRKMLLDRAAGQTNKLDWILPSRAGSKRQWVPDTYARTVQDLGFNRTGEARTLPDGTVEYVEISDARLRVVFHTLRHTFASWLVQKGQPLYTVAKLMGHTTLEMTERYSHLAPDTLEKAALSLNGILGI